MVGHADTQLAHLRTLVSREPALAFVKKLTAKISAAEVYIVGGTVRDVLVGRTDSKDYDLVVRNVTRPALEKFLRASGRVDFVGKTFGVYKFWPKGVKLTEAVDIAFPRTEHALGTGAYRDVDVSSDPNLPLERDLVRRDFTINALAWDIRKQTIVDEVGGLADLAAEKIRAVGDPKKRFQEDYSRLLRCLRFACQLSFSAGGGPASGWEIESATLAALKKMAGKLAAAELPREVVGREVIKAFAANPVAAFDLFDTTGAFRVLMPEVLNMRGCPQPKNFHSEGDVFEHTRLALEVLRSPKFKREFGNEPVHPTVVMATLFHDIGKPLTIKTPEKDGTDRIRFNGHDVAGARAARAIAERLKFSSYNGLVNADDLDWLVAHHLLFILGIIPQMQNSTIEKYFFRDRTRGHWLMQLSFADIGATIPPTGEPPFGSYRAMKKRIALLEKLGAGQTLPPPLVNGHDIMRRFKLKPGAEVGRLLAIAREAQLSKTISTKTQALALIARQSGRKRQ